jgi:hypothetical protein
MNPRVVLLWFVGAAGVGCGAKLGAGGAIGDAGNAPEASSQPAGCAGVQNAYESVACLAGLRAACQAHASPSDCSAASFSSYGVVCTWARVVKVTDSVTCNVSSDEGRCEGSWIFPDDGPFCGLWTGFVAERELVLVSRCGGPVGSWDFIGASPSQIEGPCLNGTTPPPPEICNCVSKISDAGR